MSYRPNKGRQSPYCAEIFLWWIKVGLLTWLICSTLVESVAREGLLMGLAITGVVGWIGFKMVGGIGPMPTPPEDK